MAVKYKLVVFFIFFDIIAASVAYPYDGNEDECKYIIWWRRPQPQFYPGYYPENIEEHDCIFEEMKPEPESLNLPNDDFEEDEEDDIEDEETPYLKIIPPRVLPLRRVRRRIIPRVTAKTTMDTDRGGNRDPWDRGNREHYGSGRGGGGDLRRTGPMGTEKLYELYPALAPPGWKKKGEGGRRRQNGRRKKVDRRMDDIEEDEITVSDERIRNPSQKRHEPIESKMVDEVPNFDNTRRHAINIEKRRRPKSKMTKRVKEEIAEFALKHGINGALQHFQTKLQVPIRPAAIEKFIRRYEDRMRRKQIRAELKT